MMMKKYIFLLGIFALLVSGCRREDFREMSVSLPEATAADVAKMTQALAPYEGVVHASIRWDASAKSLALKYDSMRIAQTNIRMTLEGAGLKVVYPEKKTKRAGYTPND